VFRRCTARVPTGAERKVLLSLLGKEEQRYAGAALNPWDLAANDPAHPPALPGNITPAQAAAWTIVSRAVLNLDETITKE